MAFFRLALPLIFDDTAMVATELLMRIQRCRVEGYVPLQEAVLLQKCLELKR